MSIIPKERLEEFMRLYKEAYGEEITLDEASEIVFNLTNLYMMLAEPLPSELAARALLQKTNDDLTVHA